MHIFGLKFNNNINNINHSLWRCPLWFHISTYSMYEYQVVICPNFSVMKFNWNSCLIKLYNHKVLHCDYIRWLLQLNTLETLLSWVYWETTRGEESVDETFIKFTERLSDWFLFFVPLIFGESNAIMCCGISRIFCNKQMCNPLPDVLLFSDN